MEHPPKSRLAFRVGIVGHRPNRLPKNAATLADLRNQLAAVLRSVQSAVEQFSAKDKAAPPKDAALYAQDAPLLRAISPLAEGTDRIFAEEALKLGYGLCCPMPFAKAEFETDFAHGKAPEPESVQRFNDILAAAREGPGLVTFELDGDREAEGAAYGAAGRVVLNQSDLLVVVWDGHKRAGEGGTVDTLHEALTFHVPVLWIDALEPKEWMVLRADDDLDRLKQDGRCTPKARPGSAAESAARPLDDIISGIVRQEVGLPEPGGAEARAHAAAYFAEQRPSRHFAVVWKCFRDLVGNGRFRKFEFAARTQDYILDIEGDWPVRPDDLDAKSTEPNPPEWIYGLNTLLRPHYAWADKLADRYADDHRSAGVFSYGLVALAVLIALLPMAAAWNHGHDRLRAACIVGEFVILCFILGIQLFGNRRRWHDRWTEYRLLAELVRELKFLVPLGGGRPLPRTPIHLAGHGDPARSWMSWQLRAIARSIGLQTTRVDKAYVGQCLAELTRVAGSNGGRETDDRRLASGQYGYHLSNDRAYETIHKTLGKVALSLLFLTIVGICLDFGFYLTRSSLEKTTFDLEGVGRWLTLASAVIPALGASVAGIQHFGEFARLAKRSRSMADGFRQFGVRIRTLRDRLAADEQVKLSAVIPIASDMAETMVDEVIDWRVVVLDPPRAG